MHNNFKMLSPIPDVEIFEFYILRQSWPDRLTGRTVRRLVTPQFLTSCSCSFVAFSRAKRKTFKGFLSAVCWLLLQTLFSCNSWELTKSEKPRRRAGCDNIKCCNFLMTITTPRRRKKKCCQNGQRTLRRVVGSSASGLTCLAAWQLQLFLDRHWHALQ